MNINARTLQLLSFSNEKNYQFSTKLDDYSEWEFYHFTIRKQILSIENVIQYQKNGMIYQIADITTKTGTEVTANIQKITAIKVSGISEVPKFYLQRKDFLEALKDVFDHNDITFANFPKFSKHYAIHADDAEEKVRQLFNEQLLSYMETHGTIFMSGNGKDLLVHLDDKLLSINETQDVISRTEKLVSAM